MEIVTGVSILYLQQIGKGPSDPTMKHVEDVKAYAASVIERCSVRPSEEWMDEWTVRLVLPEGHQFTI